MMAVKHLLDDMDVNVKGSMYCDNKSTISAIQNDGYSSKAKHICIRKMFVKEFWDSGEFIPVYVPSKENQADVFTKPLRRPSFESSRAILLGCFPTEWGSIESSVETRLKK
jgi:hypothetical protein